MYKHNTWYSLDRTLQWLQGLCAELVPSAATPHIPEHHIVDNAVKMAQTLLAGRPITGETSDTYESSPETEGETEEPPIDDAEVSHEAVEVAVPVARAKTISSKPKTRKVKRVKDILKIKVPFSRKVKQLLGMPVVESGECSASQSTPARVITPEPEVACVVTPEPEFVRVVTPEPEFVTSDDDNTPAEEAPPPPPKKKTRKGKGGKAKKSKQQKKSAETDELQSD